MLLTWAFAPDRIDVRFLSRLFSCSGFPVILILVIVSVFCGALLSGLVSVFCVLPVVPVTLTVDPPPVVNVGWFLILVEPPLTVVVFVIWDVFVFVVGWFGCGI